jgi:hypothetical protein
MGFPFSATLLDRRTRTGQGPEIFFARPANRAFPIIGQVGKTSLFGDLSLSVPFVGIINVAAVYRLTLIHFFGFGQNNLLQKKVQVQGARFKDKLLY